MSYQNQNNAQRSQYTAIAQFCLHCGKYLSSKVKSYGKTKEKEEDENWVLPKPEVSVYQQVFELILKIILDNSQDFEMNE